MAQHDFDVSNQTGALVRSDFNSAMAAIVSNSSGPTAPSPSFSFQFWVDTTTNLLKVRNAANTAWVTIGDPSLPYLGLLSASGSTLAGALLCAVGAVGGPGLAFNGDLDSGFYWVSANTWGLVANGVEYLRISPSGISFMSTGATAFPSGTTAERPVSPSNGFMRYNTDLLALEAYVGSNWKTLATPGSFPFSTSDFANTVELVPITSYDFSSSSSATELYAQYPWSAPVKLSDPSTLPAGNGAGCAISLNGEYMAISNTSVSPYVAIYKRKGTEFIKFPDPATLPTGPVSAVAFSSNSEFLLCGHSTTPFMTCYQRTAGTDTWTKIANPATLPPSQGTGASISPNGEFFVVTSTTSPFFSCYQRSGSVLTKIADPAVLPAGVGQESAWSPDGRFLAVGHSSSPFVSIYERTAGTTLTKLANPSSLPAGNVFDVAWSNDGTYLACVHANSPYCTVYTRSGTTFTKMTGGNSGQFSDSADFPTGQGGGVAFSFDGSHLTVAHLTSPYVSDYVLTSGKWVKQANPSSLPSANATDVCWDSQRRFMIVTYVASPYVNIYQTASDMPDSAIGIMKKIPRAGV